MRIVLYLNIFPIFAFVVFCFGLFIRQSAALLFLNTHLNIFIMRLKDLTRFLGLLALLLCGVSSCQTKEDIDEPILSVDKTELQFAVEGGELTLDVSTNQGDWTAASPEDGKWLDLRKDGELLVVRAKHNEMAETRKSYILINAGRISRTIAVSQTAADITLQLLPDNIEVPQAGGTYTIDVRSNESKWTVELDTQEDWISIRPNISSQIITLNVAPNPTSEIREAKLFARSANQTKTVEINVRQAAKVDTKYTLPNFNKSVKSSVALIEYEKSIGNYYREVVPGRQYSRSTDTYVFFLREPFAQREYSVDARGFLQQMKDISFDDQLINSDYITFLINSGFKEVENTSVKWEGVNDDLEMRVLVTPIPEQGTIVTFSRILKQKTAYPTWDVLPESTLLLHVGSGFKLADVRQAEEAAGSTDLEYIGKPNGSHIGQVEMMFCTVTPDKKPHIMNGYVFAWEDETPAEKLGILSEKITIYDKINLAYWTDEAAGKTTTTREFESLMERSGWALRFELEEQGAGRVYMKGDRGLFFRITSSSFILGGDPVLMVNGFEVDADPESTTLRYQVEHRKQYEQKFKDRIDRLNRRFKAVK